MTSPTTHQDLRRRNLAFLKETAPDFLSKLTADTTPPQAPPAVPDGPPGVISRICVEPPRPDGRHPYLTRFVENLIQAQREKEIPQFSIPTFTLSAGLAVIGNVTPAGLDHILKLTNCVYLIVIVPEPAEFLAQLDTLDWAAVDAGLRARGGRTFFATGHTPDGISAAINIVVSGTAPFILDGMTVASFDKQDLTRAVAGAMTRLAYRGLMTLGTFYDGCLMLKNSEINLRHGPALIYRNRPGIKPGLPAWVIGSGPSLDSDIGFIRDHQDKAVVISCGSALSALLAGGVTPDVHIELENVDVGLTLEPARAHELSGIALFAPASVDPVVLDTFGTVIFGFRQNLPNQPLYDVDETALPLAGEPTVVNLALAFAREQGFPQICFFGVDMGARDPARDHASGTWHTDPNSSYAGVDHPHRVAANFGGECYTTPGLRQALDALKITVAADSGNRDYVNCSDGAAITGARALKPEALDLKQPTEPKQQTVRDIVGSFDEWNPAALPAHWPGAEMSAVIHDLISGIRADIAGIQEFGSKSYLAAAADKLRFSDGHLHTAPPGPESAARMLVRGTVGSLLLFMEYYLNRVISPAHLAELGTAAKTFIDRELDALEKDAEAWIGGTEIGDIPDFDTIRTPPDMAFFDPPAVPRNAPCPCGSGKRYKQCHGRAA